MLADFDLCEGLGAKHVFPSEITQVPGGVDFSILLLLLLSSSSILLPSSLFSSCF